MAEPPDIDALIEQVRTGEGRARYLAVLGLDKAGARQAVDVILPLLDADDEGLRSIAVDALVNLGDDRLKHVGPAIEARLFDPSNLVRNAATEGLGHLRYSPARESLEKVLRDDPDFVTRSSAAEALGDIGDPRSLDVLLAALDDEFPVASYVALAIGLIGYTPGFAAGDPPGYPEVRAALRARLDGEHELYLRSELAIAAMRLGDDAAFDDLLGAFGEQPEDDETDTYDTILGNALLDMLTRKTPRVVLARADELHEKLVEFGDPGVLEQLAKLRG